MTDIIGYSKSAKPAWYSFCSSALFSIGCTRNILSVSHRRKGSTAPFPFRRKRMDCHDRHDCNGNCNTYLPPSARLLHRSVLYRTFSRASRHRATLHLVLVEEQITPDSPIPILCRLRQSADRLALYPFRLIAIRTQYGYHHRSMVQYAGCLALLIYNSRYLYHDTQALSVRRCPIAGGTLPLGKQTHAIPRQFPSHAVALGPYPHRHLLSQTSP